MMKLEPFEIPIDFSPGKIEEVETKCLPLPQVDMPITHSFSPGVYMREIFVPAGTFIIGHEHKTEHFNIMLSGEADVFIDGVVRRMKAPCCVMSKPGRKMAHVFEDMRWMNIHPNPNNETDIDNLEDMLLVKSKSFTEHQALKGYKECRLPL